jgi:glycosyltransferase involved in cell wall biosynthesis
MQSSHLFPMSRWAARSLQGDYGLEGHRITVMPPSTTLQRFRSRELRDWNVPRVLFVGNDFARKGGDRLVRWVRTYLRGKCELHIVSGDPQCPASGEGVIVHGRLRNDQLITDIMPKMDLLCHPTQSDMSAHVVVEAAAAGLPAIASNISGISDLVDDGRSGFLLPPNDEHGFVRALEALCLDPDRCRSMGDTARELARSRFSADTNYRMLLDMLVAMGGQRRLPAV